MQKFAGIIVLLVVMAATFMPYFLSHDEVELTMADFRRWRIEQKRNARPAYGDPGKAMQWFYEQRAYPSGAIPDGWREKALQHIAKHNTRAMKPSETQALSWTQLGPGNIGGRIRSIIVHPTNPQILYIGSVSGGVWKTTNGGSTWFPLKDDMENLAVCSVVMDPTNPEVLYAGTGEGYFNVDAVRGAGIFKTTDAGASWNRLTATSGVEYYYVNKLVIDPSTNILWAGTRKGLYASTNGGATFIPVLTGQGGNDVHFTEVEVAGTSPSTIYAAAGLFGGGTVYRSTDGGSSFAPVLQDQNYGRIEIGVSPSDPLRAYVSIMNPATSGTGTMGYTTNGGGDWFSTSIAGPSYAGSQTYTGTQAWYDNILAVDPANADIVYAGGIDFWKTVNGGTSWIQKTNWYQDQNAPPYVHADHHAVAFDPSNPGTVYLGTDGGIFKSTDNGETWTGLNAALFITQFYYGAVHPTANVCYGGTQDNGTLKSSVGTNWIEIVGGDGGATEVDFTNPDNIYMEYVHLAIFKSTNGGASYVKKMIGIPSGPNLFDGTTDRVLFIAPFSMDPNNPSGIVAGTYRVFRTTDGAENWTPISGDLTGAGTGAEGAKVSTVIVAKGTSDVIYAGCTNGRVQVTTDGGGTWNLRNAGLPDAYCTRIATDPSDPAVAYATYSGFVAGAKVYRTTNYGASWANISNNLPNIPVSCIVVNPEDGNHLVVGTDLGIFTSVNGGSTWTQDNGGMANVVVSDLDYRSSDKTLFAATHGRSFFSAPLTGGGGEGQIVEIAYDDGTPSSGYYWPNAGEGSANRITPTVSGAKLVEMSIYIMGANSGSPTYTPVVLGNNGGTPGPALAALVSKTAVSVPGWDATDLTASDITVAEDFFIGLVYDGTNQPVFGYDQTNNGRAWDYTVGMWTAWTETYFMRVKIQTPTSVAEIDTRIPERFELSQNYPNPFNPSTTIRYALPRGRDTRIVVYDLAGREVAELVNNFQDAGTYEIIWNGRNSGGQSVASGTYIVTVRAGEYSSTRKMLLLR